MNYLIIFLTSLFVIFFSYQPLIAKEESAITPNKKFIIKSTPNKNNKDQQVSSEVKNKNIESKQNSSILTQSEVKKNNNVQTPENEVLDDKNSEEVQEKSSKNKSLISEKLWKKFSKTDMQILQSINKELENKNYDEAMRLAKVLKSNYGNRKNSLADAVFDIVLWNKYSNKFDVKKTSFTDISTFVMDSPYLPNIKELRKNVEKSAIYNDIDYNISETYFNSNPALTPESKLYVVESKISKIARDKLDEQAKDEKSKDIQSEISQIWIKENFSEDLEKQFLEKYKNILTESNHADRIERLLWDGKKQDAFRIMGYVNEDYRNLFDAILKIEESPRYIDNIILNVPRRLRSNELLTFKRMIWYKSQDKIDEIIDILSDIPNHFKMHEKWWSFKRLYGREMLKQSEYKKSYKIISQHNLPVDSSNFWEAEWTAGWVALRFLDKPKDALKHFQKMRKNVYQPVTISRAIYWEAMCHEAMGNKSEAIQTYKLATNYPIFFYGQLAIHKSKTLDPLGSEKDIILPRSPDITGRDILKISESRGAQIAYILAVAGDRENASNIFEWLINNAPTDGQIAVIMNIVAEIGDKALDARISRIASKKNVFFVKEKFQIVKEVINDEYAPLVHAIIKQESGFATTAVSRVGALGYMQLMPATAKLVAKELGVSFNQKKLNTDISYNVRLGSHYIKKLINEFDGSEILAIASYNAGPNATKRWINEFYDPRGQKDQDKIVDWIELITYSETRNYVQRIIENMIVYKYLMSRSNYDEVR